MTFITQLLLFSAITFASTLPLMKVSQIVRKPFNRRRWFGSAAIFALVAAGLAAISRNLVDSCLAERNNGCVDIGGAGGQALLLGGFVGWALLSAYLTYNEF